MAKYPETPVPQYPYETMQLWRNMVSQFDDGREQRRRKGTFPTYDVTLTYNGLTRTDIDMLWNFYQDREGTFREFYFFTPFDESHKGLFVAVADGVKDTYDLPGIVAGATTVYVDGLPTAVTLLTGGGDEGADRCCFGQVLASGTIARDTLKISAADGVAFVDPSSDAVASAAFLAAVNNHDAIEITSKTDGKKMHGYVKAAGTGETYGAERVKNPTFDADATSWSQYGCTLTSSYPAGGGHNNDYGILTSKGSGEEHGTSPFILQLIIMPTGCLCTVGGHIKNGNKPNQEVRIYKTFDGHGCAVGFSSSSWSEIRGYFTETGYNSFYIQAMQLSVANETVFIDEIFCRQVLTPSVTGVTITSTPGGDTQNWADIEAGFDFYDAAGYDWEIIRHGSIPVAGAVISCDLFGRQRIRCRFAEDNLSRELFMARIYRTGIKLKGLKG